MALKSLAEVQTNPTIETAKQITHLLNHSAKYSDAVSEYRRSGIIFHEYSDNSYISEPEARIRAGGYFFLGPKSNTQIKVMPPENGAVHVECSIMINVVVSATEEEL